MKLKRFQVTNFRSIEDSGWIEVEDVTALIGTNESGKTNVLLPLWKFNPAREGGIVPTADYPRKRYNEFRNLKPKPVFIRAVFDVGDDLAQQLAAKTGLPPCFCTQTGSWSIMMTFSLGLAPSKEILPVTWPTVAWSIGVGAAVAGVDG